MKGQRYLTKFLKFATLARSYVKGCFMDTAGFVRVIPTDRCNLHCQYCWQRDDDSHEMTREDFADYLVKAQTLGVGLVSFLGGEPMLWEEIYDAIAACSKRHILTDMTTNGTLLNQETIAKLSVSGLDYLNISTDGLKISSVSKKNNLIRRELIGALKDAKKRYGMHSRLNAVIFKDNFEEVRRLVEFSKINNIQLSIGYVVPPVNRVDVTDSDIYFSLHDHDRLHEIIDFILKKKRAGYPIIDPDAYFKNIFRYLHRERFWDCNYPTRYGWINIAPNGRLRSCTKKMDELGTAFLELDNTKIKKLREQLRKNIIACNPDCYSNCAYDSSYYVRNKMRLGQKILYRVSAPILRSFRGGDEGAR
jgi:MoaA/NifB/PqqE/SkfB family radical SAM enzyme